MLTLVKAASLYPDEVRIFQTDTTPEFREAVIHQMVTGKTTHSSKCRADFRGVCDSTVEAAMTRIYLAALNQYIDELYDADIRDNFEFFMDWSVNAYRDGKAAFNHTHNEAFVTMCFYPNSCEGGKQTTFNSALIELKTGQLVVQNSDGIPIWDRFAKNESRLHFRHVPKAGELVVFPGHMPHWTVPGETEPRYCLTAFVMVKQKTARKVDLK